MVWQQLLEQLSKSGSTIVILPRVVPVSFLLFPLLFHVPSVRYFCPNSSIVADFPWVFSKQINLTNLKMLKVSIIPQKPKVDTYDIRLDTKLR